MYELRDIGEPERAQAEFAALVKKDFVIDDVKSSDLDENYCCEDIVVQYFSRRKSLE